MKYAVAALIATTTAHKLMTENEQKFMSYVTEYGKNYATQAEYKFRFAQFVQRIGNHEIHNSK